MTVQAPKILWDNRLADALAVASSTAATYNVVNLSDWRAYTYWQPTSLPATVTVNCGSAKAADYGALYRHDLATQGVSVEVRGSTDNFSANDVLLTSSTPTTDEPLLLPFNSASYQYWRWRFTGGANMPTIALASIGAALTFELPVPYGFDPLGRKVVSARNRSIAGWPLGTVLEFEEWSESINARNASQTWLRNTFLPAWDAHLVAEPFLFAWDPGDHASEIYLVNVSGELRAPHRELGRCDVLFPVSGVVT